jgi:hypothetical protein
MLREVIIKNVKIIMLGKEELGGSELWRNKVVLCVIDVKAVII